MLPNKYPKVLVEEFSDSAIELGSLHNMNLTLTEVSIKKCRLGYDDPCNMGLFSTLR
ncbi:MAG: hypothetical protein HRU09_13885, partial [Oligoflexales bacterium]|nr:hypothetical protein [Oligoflexales bacterium]